MLLIELQHRQAAEMIDTLASRGIVVADAACFGGLGPRQAIRVSLRDRDANVRLLAALGEA
jgi:histidinol-phosphate/aromatic aminotransferase/cobyric acid decarboxylase-like protein